MRMLYMERRRALVNAIQIQMRGRTEVIGAEAGMHLVALLQRGINDVEVSRKAAHRGISAMPLSVCYSKAPTRGGLILGYGGANAHQIHDGIRKLSMTLEGQIAYRAAMTVPVLRYSFPGMTECLVFRGPSSAPLAKSLCFQRPLQSTARSTGTPIRVPPLHYPLSSSYP